MKNPFDPATAEHAEWERQEAAERAQRDTDGTRVPNARRPEQAKGQRDSQDTETPEQRDARLLGVIRDGTWLDAQTFPPLRYAVDDLLPEGFTVLVGPPKVGKSWLVGNLLLAVASGGTALGCIHLTGKRPVLYLALEDGDRRMQSRCRRLLGDEPLPPLFHYVTRVQPGEVLPTIDAFLRRHPDTALVVIDTLGKVMPPAGPNETTYQRDYRVGGRIKAIADGLPGLAVVAVHHDRKAEAEDFVERVSGTNGLAGSADTIIVLARKRQSTSGLLMVTGRDVPEAEYALTMVDGTHWQLDGQDLAEAAENAREREEDASGQLSDTSAQIIRFVREHPDGVTRKEVVDKFGDNAGRYLARHTDAGWLERIGRGKYRVPTVPTSFSQVNAGTERDSDSAVSRTLSRSRTVPEEQGTGQGEQRSPFPPLSVGNGERRCLACQGPIDPAAGDVHPGCEGVRR